MSAQRYGGTLQSFLNQAALANITIPEVGEVVRFDGRPCVVASAVMDEILLVPVETALEKTT